MARSSLKAAWIRYRNSRRFPRLYMAERVVDFTDPFEFRGEQFAACGPACWLDRPDAFLQVETKLRKGEIDAEEAEACRTWIVEGYWIARGLIDEATLDSCWEAYERALCNGTLGEPPAIGLGALPDRKLDPHLAIPELNALMRHPKLLRFTDLFLGRKTIPFQTIVGHAGSQQAAHSDAIHMTTYPLGYLVACWIAFEDIHPDSGPLEYYPKSHRLPYVLSAEAGIPPFAFKECGYTVYNERYEPLVRDYCARYGFEPRAFLARKGDVLFWHANLIHGGSARVDFNHSRKALVCHYFAEGAVTYHDLSGNPSRLHARGMYEPISE